MIDLCNEFARTEWPSVLGLTKVSLPPKNDNPFLPAHGRPICILSQIYRIWAKCIAACVLKNFASWVPPSIIGGLPKRAASDVWFTMQLRVELAHHHNCAMHGFALDVQKCYNGIPRKQIIALFCRLGLPSWIADAWEKFLGLISRTVQIKSSVSTPQLSYTGIPEGDPLSVPAMLSLCVLWEFFMTRDLEKDSVKIWAYLDNLEFTTQDIELLCYGITKS